MNRFYFTIESLGGLTNPALQEVHLSEEEEKELLEIEEAKEEAAEEAFAAEIWENTCKMTEFLLGYLGLDNGNNDLDRLCCPNVDGFSDQLDNWGFNSEPLPDPTSRSSHST